jgi:hypothetical protein
MEETASQLERSGRIDPDGPGVTVNTVTPGFIATECSTASLRR